MAFGFAKQHPVIAFYVLVFAIYLVAWSSLLLFNFDPRWQATIFIMSGTLGPALAAAIVIGLGKKHASSEV